MKGFTNSCCFADPQLEMARIIQAMVNGQRPNDVHVEFNAPNVMSINLPVHVMTGVRQAPAPGATETTSPSAPTEESSPESTPAAGNGDSPNAASTSTRTADPRANTLPTTATQTRSTSRPQIQIGGNNNWGGRIAPTHAAFDRFLPCNSHHIREPEPLPHSTNAQGASTNRGTSTASAVGAAVVSPTAAVGTRPGEYCFPTGTVIDPLHTHDPRHDPPRTPTHFIRTLTNQRWKALVQ